MLPKWNTGGNTVRLQCAHQGKETDFLVIGGGSGGLGAARAASASCVPKKVTFNAAAIAETIHQAKSYCFSLQETAPFDWTTFKQKRDAYIHRLNGIYERNLNNDKVEYVHGWAKVISRNHVKVTLADGTTDPRL
ncbi:GTP-binding protein gtr1 [Staphylotrichum longicolle]|uniref:GTP-binding protein gtr1 n=1 Tax=Staphylotrichum longicolle TaxID=669026 RepID=A0AAD4HWL4_9PEZI|nr:GTP-binding protein gtr1 [Staphylotrichum longicolle]